MTELGNLCCLDFDPELEEVRKFVSSKVAAIEAKGTQKRLKEEERLRKRLAERKAAVEAARAEQEAQEKAGAAGMGGMFLSSTLSESCFRAGSSVGKMVSSRNA